MVIAGLDPANQRNSVMPVVFRTPESSPGMTKRNHEITHLIENVGIILGQALNRPIIQWANVKYGLFPNDLEMEEASYGTDKILFGGFPCK